MVFLDNPDYNHGQGMRIHIRTKIVHWWSYVESAVVQIGEDTLEVRASSSEKKYWHNGKLGADVIDRGMMPFTVGGHKVRFRVRSDTQWQFKIFLEDGQEIILRAVKEFLRVDIMHHRKESFGNSRGLMGSYEEGLMMGRDGRVLEDPKEFGNEWQVHIDEPLLFHNIDGVQHPETCAEPLAEAKTRRLAMSMVSREAALKACMNGDKFDFEDCVADVLAIGNVEIAEIYKAIAA